jgi:hypothetical protein
VNSSSIGVHVEFGRNTVHSDLGLLDFFLSLEVNIIPRLGDSGGIVVKSLCDKQEDCGFETQ